MFKKLAVVTVIVALLAIGAGSVFAAPPSTSHPGQVYSSTYNVWVPAFQDGRINAFNMMEPVAVYYNYGTANVLNSDGTTSVAQVVNGIDVWTIDATSTGQFDFMVTMDQINAARNASKVTVLGSGRGFTLSYDPSSTSFTISGQGYFFTWVG